MTDTNIGEVIFIAFKPLFKMAAVALGGAFFCRKGVLTVEVTRSLATLIISFLLPLLIFSTVTASFDADSSKAIIVLLITAIFYQVLGLCYGFLVRVFTPVPKEWKGGVLAVGTFCNQGELIIAFSATLARNAPFHPEKDIAKGTAYAAIFMMVQTLAMWNCGGVQLIQRDFKNKVTEDPEKDEQPSAMISTVNTIAEKTRQTIELVRSTSRSVSLRRRSSVGAQFPGERYSALSVNDMPPVPIPAHRNNPTMLLDGLCITEEPESQVPTAVNSRSNSITSSVAPTLKNFKFASETPPPTPPSPSPTSNEAGKWGWLKKIWGVVGPFFNGPSIAMILALIIANVPALKSLFVVTRHWDMPSAPDDRPPLDFVMEICYFGGGCAPTLGLILLGAALSRLEVNGLPKGFWKSVLSMSVLKLIVGPVIGIVWTTMIMSRTGWVGPDDKMLKFVMIVAAGVPTATGTVYLTAVHASEKSIQVSALGAMLLAQYLMMIFTMTIMVSYTLMVVL